MQFIDLRAQYMDLKEEIDQGISSVLNHGKYIMGPEVLELESELSAYIGRDYCISCANGTDALELSLMALGIGQGDAVFVPSFTFMSTAEVVSSLGALPVFVDVDPETFNISTASLECAIDAICKDGTHRPAAIIPVDLFGQPANYPGINPIADKYGLIIVEDAAQGFGGSIKGKFAGSYGELSCFSFFPAKPLGCYGDGGAILTDDEGLASLLKSLRVHGKGKEKYDNVRIGRNSRLDTIQAAILLPKLRAFREFELEARNKIAEKYSSFLKGSYKVPAVPDGFVSSWAQYTITCDSGDQRDRAMSSLRRAEIPSMVYYPRPLHLQTAFQSYPTWGVDLSESQKLSERVLSLPMHPYLEDADIEHVVDILTK